MFLPLFFTLSLQYHENFAVKMSRYFDFFLEAVSGEPQQMGRRCNLNVFPSFFFLYEDCKGYVHHKIIYSGGFKMSVYDYNQYIYNRSCHSGNPTLITLIRKYNSFFLFQLPIIPRTFALRDILNNSHCVT